MISVVVPVYNEERNIPSLLEELLPVLDDCPNGYEVICINDGSTDRSLEILKAVAAGNSHVKVIDFARNFGQTSAMMAGVTYASGDIIVPIDADLQNDPNDIPGLLAKLREGFDVVSGWRRNRRDKTFRRVYLSRIANWIISKVTHLKLHDYGCTLKAYRSTLIKEVNLYGEMHRFIPVYVSLLGGKVTEMEVNHRPRKHGVSKYGVERILKVLLDLLVIKFLTDYDNKPIYVFGMLGLFNIFLSFLAAGYALYLKIFHAISYILTPLPLLVVFTFTIGSMFIVMGLLAEILMRTYYESQQKSPYFVKSTYNLGA